MIAIGLLMALAAPSGACHAIDGMRILGRHLAAADSTFVGLPADLFVGYAPSPGVRRVLKPAELARIAQRHGLVGNAPNELCFEWPLFAVEPERMIEAMRRNSGLAQARIEVVESDRHPAPHGEIVFPPGGLVSTPAVDKKGGALWRGYIQYAPNRRFVIWARVRIAVAENRIIANRPLREGEIIRAEDLRIEDQTEFSFHNRAAVRIEDVAGQTPRRPIRAGDAILRSLLEAPKDINKGDSVEVTVVEKNLRFRSEGLAETAGRRGEMIRVRNVTSGKTFHAKVEASGRVTVTQRAAIEKGTSE